MKKVVLFILMGCLMLTLCSCQSSKDSSRETIEELSKQIDESSRRMDQLTRDMQDVSNIFQNIRNGK